MFGKVFGFFCSFRVPVERFILKSWWFSLTTQILKARKGSKGLTCSPVACNSEVE